MDKENKNNFKRVKIAITFFLCLSMILLTGVYLLFLFTHKDKNRNRYTPREIETQEIIRSKLNAGFNNISETGKYSFRLNVDELNQIILNSLSDVLPSKAESMYFDEEVGQYNIYIDLKKTLGVPTRIRYSLEELTVNSREERAFKVSSKRMGSLPYLKHNLSLETLINELSSKSGLPIRYQSNSFIVSPLKLLNNIEDEDSKCTLKEFISLNPSCVYLDKQSIFGFDIDLSKFKNPNIEEKLISDESNDLYSLMKSSITKDFLSSIEEGESKKACDISIKDINYIVSSNALSRFKNDDSILKVKDIYMVIVDTSHIKFIIESSFCGYSFFSEDDIEINYYPNELKIGFYLKEEIKINGVKLNKDSYISNKLLTSLFEVISNISESNSTYMNYESSNRLWVFDFTSLSNDLIKFYLYDYDISPTLLDEVGFKVMVSNK